MSQVNGKVPQKINDILNLYDFRIQKTKGVSFFFYMGHIFNFKVSKVGSFSQWENDCLNTVLQI